MNSELVDRVGRTALWVAASRALETESGHPLFSDPLARELAGEGGFRLMQEFRAASGHDASSTKPGEYLSIRTRYFDDAIVQAVKRLKLDQLVILGAGMDSRAFRLEWPHPIVVFEVDRLEVMEYKHSVLERLEASPTCERRVVAADLAESWAPLLLNAGFDPRSRSAFLIEGLLFYLSGGSVDRILKDTDKLARDGSWLGADILGTEVLTSPLMRGHLSLLEKIGCPWTFGVRDPEALLAAHGWDAEVVLAGEPGANYGRWPFPVIPRTVPGFPRMYLVQAYR